jgi:hypothetical protein
LFYLNSQFYDGLAFAFLPAKKPISQAGVHCASRLHSNQPNNLGDENMKMSKVLLAAVTAAPMLIAQPTATSFVSLKTTSIGETPLKQRLSIPPDGGVMCDGAGNVYAMRSDTEGWKVHRLPIQEITSKGGWGTEFQAPKSLSGYALRGGFVGHDGRVYMLVYTGKDTYVVEFAPNGSVNAQTKLDMDRFVDIWHLAVFKSGEFLLVGTADKDRRTPFTAVYAANGKQIKKIYEPEDEDAYRQGKIAPEQRTRVDNNNNFVWGGDVAAGSDGNVYLLRGGYPSLVYVISPAGEVLNKLRIDTGNPEFIANSLKFYAGHLAIGFDRQAGDDQIPIKIIDLQGNSVADYKAGGNFSGGAPILACYNSEGITMLPSYSESTLYLLKAKLP